VPASAANPATFLHLLLRMVEQANRSPSTRNKGGGLRSSYGVSVRPKKAAIRVDSRQDADENYGPTGVPESYSGSCSVTASSLSSARRHGALLLRLRRPPGYGFHLRWTHRKCRAWRLGAGPLAWLRPV
jgi:hypothetical protein